MNLKHVSQFKTGIKSKLGNKADKDEKKLIDINLSTKRLFVVGNYHSGTRWLNYLIIDNTPINSLYSLRNQHKYLDDNNNIKNNFKHGILTEELLNQKNIVIIYIIRDFDNFLNSFLKNSYDKTIKNGIVSGTNMNIYEWYCYMLESNISLLKNSESKYIIASLEQLQETKGKSLLNILEKYGFKFIKPYNFIEKHTKTRKIEQNQKKYQHKLLFQRNNLKIENLLKTLIKQPEICLN